MMKRMLTILFGIVLLAVPSTAIFAYDQGLATSYEKFFQPFSGGATAKTLQQIKVPDFVKAVKKGGKLVVLDVRTPAESGVFGMTVPGTLTIPMDQVFKPENLAQIPTDQKVVVVCKAGHRAFVIAWRCATPVLRTSIFSRVVLTPSDSKAVLTGQQV
jgi:hypothetical protein